MIVLKYVNSAEYLIEGGHEWTEEQQQPYLNELGVVNKQSVMN